MNEEFKYLNDIVAEDIDTDRISNPNLKGVMDSIICYDNGYVFLGKGKHHTDYKEVIHTDEGRKTPISDKEVLPQHKDIVHNRRHRDHKDHTDYQETKHKDNKYRESAAHTDSSGGHRDYKERSHRDK